MKDDYILKILKDNGIKSDENSVNLVSAFRLGFDHGWWLALDEEVVEACLENEKNST